MGTKEKNKNVGTMATTIRHRLVAKFIIILVDSKSTINLTSIYEI